jgi:hypothetical protein
MVPEVMLKEWAQYTYTDPTDYWTFRKQVRIWLLGIIFEPEKQLYLIFTLLALSKDH